MKKILAFVMAMAMVLGMSLTSFAEEDQQTPPAVESTTTSTNVNGTENDRGTITVKGIDAEKKNDVSSVKVYACKIVEPQYGNDGYFTAEYKGLVDTLNNSEGIFDDNKLTASIMGDLKAKMVLNADKSAWTINKEDTAEAGAWTGAVYEMQENQEGNYSASVPVGAYLVLVMGGEAKFYSPIVVSASYVGDDGQSGIQSDVLNIENGTAWVKVSDTPDLTKTAEVPDRDKNDSNTDEVSVNIGDVIDYTITVNPIPNYDGAYPKFKVTDTLNNGLDYTYTASETVTDFASSIKVQVGDSVLEKGKDYTVTLNSANARTFSVDFVVDGKYTLGSYSGKSMTIVYKAKVNTDAAVNSGSNTNTVTLEYSKDSNIEGEEGEKEAETFNYTFDLSTSATGSKTDSILNKVGETTDSTTTKEALKGATFTLYTDAECKNIYTNDYMPGGTVVSADGQNGTTAGALIIRGLAAGTYYMKETAAPAGYSLNSDVYKIEIDASYYDVDDSATGKKKGELKEWKVTITNTNTEKNENPVTTTLNGGSTENNTKVEIPNTKLSSLPSTGGIGTTIFTIGGCAIMIVAAGLYFASRRKSSK